VVSQFCLTELPGISISSLKKYNYSIYYFYIIICFCFVQVLESVISYELSADRRYLMLAHGYQKVSTNKTFRKAHRKTFPKLNPLYFPFDMLSKSVRLCLLSVVQTHVFGVLPRSGFRDKVSTSFYCYKFLIIHVLSKFGKQ
jgi:hypothetical protein